MIIIVLLGKKVIRFKEATWQNMVVAPHLATKRQTPHTP